MTTIGKARLKKLLSKGLTGREAERLMIQEGLDRERGKPGLTDVEINAIIDSLKNQRDIEDYNRLPRRQGQGRGAGSGSSSRE